MWILWPSFLVAAGAVGVFFSLFDPIDLVIFGAPVRVSRLGAYAIGFFGFWCVGIASSAITLLLARSRVEVNRAPAPLEQRAGSIKGEDPPGGDA